LFKASGFGEDDKGGQNEKKEEVVALAHTFWDNGNCRTE